MLTHIACGEQADDEQMIIIWKSMVSVKRSPALPGLLSAKRYMIFRAKVAMTAELLIWEARSEGRHLNGRINLI